ncbi:hypothetical protein FRACYDRAFT_243874 [Fragilariopsis cylindrus CCMP1102]|uniref:Uncharacterized protein n=1 Tax=Fragilariopsis cylindrus CCMP1102 TaxID=635003 RepID=A0A1E7F370_9STRA|nr:hypothetical protein FRACYDRAFT_243874 [Fragilariopsis cylindrus CCMP1102]|eukprot:OEU12621.1 hypothetical protein FRACYDRAFT_243874 [Fragilariopsis cylindrus CCMP1102]
MKAHHSLKKSSSKIQVAAWNKFNEPVAIQTYPLNGGAKRRQAKSKLVVQQQQQQESSSSSSSSSSAVALPLQQKQSVVQSPFPTLFWLTCPNISKAIAELEGRGYVKIFENELNLNPSLHHHNDITSLQNNSDNDNDNDSGDNNNNYYNNNNQQNKSKKSSDTDNIDALKVPPIKCLHAHYAHYRSTIDIITNMEDDSDLNSDLNSDSTATTTTTATTIVRTINPVGEMIHKQLEKDFPDLGL